MLDSILVAASFGLLHGAFEGSWCWERLIPELRRLGHRSITVDLPIDDVSATWDDHVDIALAAFDDPETVIVAHSRSGRLVPRLLERGRYRRVLLLSASIPGGTRAGPYSTGATPAPAGGIVPRTVDDEGHTVCTPELAAALFSDCAKADVDWALANARPQHEMPVPPDTRWPRVSVDYIFGTDERVTAPD